MWPQETNKDLYSLLERKTKRFQNNWKIADCSFYDLMVCMERDYVGSQLNYFDTDSAAISFQ